MFALHTVGGREYIEDVSFPTPLIRFSASLDIWPLQFLQYFFIISFGKIIIPFAGVVTAGFNLPTTFQQVQE